MNTLSMILFNFFVNSLFSFFTIYLLTRGFLFLFRCDHLRVVGWALSLSILKMGIDLVLYDYAHWAYGAGLNLFDAPFGSCSLNIGLGFPCAFFGFTLQNIYRFSPADLLASFFGIVWVKRMVFGLGVATFVRILPFLGKTSWKKGDTLKPYPFPIQNPQLQNRLGKTALFVSEETITPCATGVWKKRVILPEKMVNERSWEEVEVVIAHELHHLRRQDPLLLGFLRGFKAIFWWIPMKGILNRIVAAIDEDCDREAIGCGFDPLSLAEGILWTSKHCRRAVSFHASLTSGVHPTRKRIESNLLYRQKSRGLFWKVVALSITLPTFFLGKLWLF